MEDGPNSSPAASDALEAEAFYPKAGANEIQAWSLESETGSQIAIIPKTETARCSTEPMQLPLGMAATPHR